MRRAELNDKALAIGVTARTAVRPRPTEQSQIAAWFWSSCLVVVIWSVSYLIRQPGVATSTLTQPFSPLGDFALEGAVLALAWLAILAAACLAILTGAARIEETTEHPRNGSAGR